MKLSISKSKNTVIYYVAESYRKPNGTSSTRTVKKIGSEAELREKLGDGVDIKVWCQEYVRKLTADAKAHKPVPVELSLIPDVPYEKNVIRSFNVGYLFLQRILYQENISQMVKEIKSRHSFQFNLEKIICDLIYARILDPSSKKSTYDYCHSLLEAPDYELHDVYRALDIIHKETDFIQSFLYQQSVKCSCRDTSVLFYDCTNFFFEIDDEDELRRVGFSKEHRTTPIVQLGLFTDRRGIPLGFSVFNGSQSEQISLTPLEEKILNDFNLPDSRLIVCTDSGLASFDNKEFNAKTHLIKNSLNCITTDYITIRPLRKMDAVTLEWALNRGRSLTLNPIKDGENPDKVFAEIERTGWRTEGSNRVFSLDEIDEDDPENYNRIFYKEKYVIITPSAKSKNKGKTLEERLIVTYSIKYKHFMQHKRLLNLNKASRMIAAKNSKKLDLKASDSVRKFIQIQSVDNKGNTITDSSNRYSLDEAAILEDARYDGFYAVSTNISPEVMPVKEIITVNKGRWEIEESFMIMKSELRARPVYLQNSERIKAHFTTCFMSLQVLRILEQKLNEKMGKIIPIQQLISTLRKMQITTIDKYYTGAYTRTDITDGLYDLLGMRFDSELITKGKIEISKKISKKILKNL